MKHSTTNTPGTTASSLPVLCFLPFWGPPQLCWDACTHVASDRSGRACRRGLGRGTGAGVTRAVRDRAPMCTALRRRTTWAAAGGRTCSGRGTVRRREQSSRACSYRAQSCIHRASRSTWIFVSGGTEWIWPLAKEIRELGDVHRSTRGSDDCGQCGAVVVVERMCCFT